MVQIAAKNIWKGFSGVIMLEYREQIKGVVLHLMFPLHTHNLLRGGHTVCDTLLCR